MQALHVEAGEAIFRAGDPSIAVYVIQEGEVAITVGDDDPGIEVARIGAGALFGESGVLERRPRSATATATLATTLLVTEAEVFLRAFGLENERALALVRLLCSRLRSTTQRAAHSGASPGPASGNVQAHIRLLPDHPRLASEFHTAPADVLLLPFQVGNRFGGEMLPATTGHSCCIAARNEPDLAAPHFEILRRDGGYGVRDLGGRYGTIVNNTRIGRASLDSFHPLHAGVNTVIAGRPESPFRFLVQISG